MNKKYVKILTVVIVKSYGMIGLDGRLPALPKQRYPRSKMVRAPVVSKSSPQRFYRRGWGFGKVPEERRPGLTTMPTKSGYLPETLRKPSERGPITPRRAGHVISRRINDEGSVFKDRVDAGKQLAEKLKEFENRENTVVVGLPRGGVVTAFQIAQALNLPLDIVVPRKIGSPYNPEAAIGAVTEDGAVILDEGTVGDRPAIKETIEKEKKEAARRLKTYRAGMPPRNFTGKTIILVDDGVATGHTIKAAVRSLKQYKPQKIVVAVSVIPPEVHTVLGRQVDQIVALKVPDNLFAVGQFYQSFTQVEDAEVVKLLKIAFKSDNVGTHL